MLDRMRSVEFAAELTILLIEGPQDKKSSIDLYYGHYKDRFPDRIAIERRLKLYWNWILDVLPNLSLTRYRKPVDFYSLIGALDQISERGNRLAKLSAGDAGQELLEFERQTKMKDPPSAAAQYVAAASRQTDNLVPRTTRIGILAQLLKL